MSVLKEEKQVVGTKIRRRGEKCICGCQASFLSESYSLARNWALDAPKASFTFSFTGAPVINGLGPLGVWGYS